MVFADHQRNYGGPSCNQSFLFFCAKYIALFNVRSISGANMALWSSIRFSLRILRKHWKLTSIAVSSLAIAMAAGTAGFSVFNALLLRPPAVLRPDQLLTVYSSTPTEEFNGFCDDDYTFYRDHNEIFSDVMAF